VVCGGLTESCVRQIHRLTRTQNKMQRRLAVFRRAYDRVEELTTSRATANRNVGR